MKVIKTKKITFSLNGAIAQLKGRQIARFQTDDQGNFHVPLAPGKYILHPETPDRVPFPFAEDQAFVVLPGEFTRIIVLYESGIR